MLETIREYGRDQLDEAEPARRDRAPRCVLRAVRARGGGRACGARTPRRGSPASSRSCRTSAPRWRARSSAGSARGRCGSRRGLGRYWEARSSATEGRSWIDQALAAGPVADADRASASCWAARLAFFQGDLDGSRRALRRRGAGRAGRRRRLRRGGVARATSAWVSRERGDLPPARRRSSGAARFSPSCPTLGAVGGPASALRGPSSATGPARASRDRRGGPGAQARGRRRDRDLGQPEQPRLGRPPQRRLRRRDPQASRRRSRSPASSRTRSGSTSPSATSALRRCCRGGTRDARGAAPGDAAPLHPPRRPALRGGGGARPRGGSGRAGRGRARRAARRDPAVR